MTIYIADKKYNFTEEELDYMYIDEGQEANIYRLGDIILKIYKENSPKAKLNYKVAKKLSKIHTKRFLMPSKPIFNEEGLFIGHTTKFLNSYSLKNIAKIKMACFLEELKQIEEDIDILSSEHVDIMDLTTSNTIYNGNINFCDPGSFVLRPQKSSQYLASLNKKELEIYLIDELFPSIVSLTKKQKQNLAKYFSTMSYEEIFTSETIPTEKVATYIKRISK